MISPSVGRVVWFTPAKGDVRFEGYSAPFAAHVAYVWGDHCINVMVIHPSGSNIIGETSVRLFQGAEEPTSDDSRYAEWMPFQKGQAAKVDEIKHLASAGKPLI